MELDFRAGFTNRGETRKSSRRETALPLRRYLENAVSNYIRLGVRRVRALRKPLSLYLIHYSNGARIGTLTGTTATVTSLWSNPSALTWNLGSANG